MSSDGSGGLTALIVGLGGLGRRHARNLKRINPAIRLMACRTHSTNANDLGADAALFDEIGYDLDRAIAKGPQLAIIATPATRHIADAIRLARAGVHLFVEKPIADRLDDARALVDVCRERSLSLTVGYNLRFEPSLQAAKAAVDAGRVGRVQLIRAEVGQYLPDWRPGRDYRTTASAQAGLGGGPLLELSHEFDYVRWLAGDVRTVRANTARVGDLEIDVPDVADIALQFESGAVGSIHLDFLDRAVIRRCRIVGTEGTIVWDAIERSAKLLTPPAREWVTLEPLAPPVWPDTYLSEMARCLDCVAGRGVPLVSGEDGLAALRIAVAAGQSAESGRTVAL